MTKNKQLHRLLKVVSPHPDWDENSGDSEYEIDVYEDKKEAEKQAQKLGRSYGDATHRAYYHCVRSLTVK